MSPYSCVSNPTNSVSFLRAGGRGFRVFSELIAGASPYGEFCIFLAGYLLHFDADYDELIESCISPEKVACPHLWSNNSMGGLKIKM